MRLNLGCDDIAVDGYLGVDLYPETSNGVCGVAADVMALPFADDSIETIWASHVLEHLEWDQVPFEEWHRVLEPGGKVTIAFPDMFETLLRLYEGKIGLYWYNMSVFGGKKIRADMHSDIVDNAPPEYFDHYQHPGHVHNSALTGPIVLAAMWPFFPDAAMTDSCEVRDRMWDIGETMITGTKPKESDGDDS